MRAVLLSCVLSSFFYISESCNLLKVESSNEEFDYLNGAIFKLNPTLLADGRPVYEEIRTDDQPKRMIHHFSHDSDLDNPNSPDQQTNIDNIEFYGRWVIGGDIYSGNGWAFLPSWCIDPSHEMIESYINSDTILNTPKYTKNQDDEQRQILNNKDKWNVFIDGSWRQSSLNDLNVICYDSKDNNGNNDNNDETLETLANNNRFSNPLLDWLFITFKDDITVSWFRMNITNDFNLNLHGFYYRIHENYWRKVDTNIFFEIVNDDNGNNNYRFFVYFGYTDENGVPLFHDSDNGVEKAGVIDPVQFIATGTNSGDILNNVNDQHFPTTWNLVRNNTQLSEEERANNADNIDTLTTIKENVKLEIKYRTNKDETIYDIFRNYYNNIKNESFYNSIMNTLAKDELITINDDSGSGGASYLSSILGGNDNSENKLSEESMTVLNNVTNKLLVRLNNGMLFSMVGFGTGGLGGGFEEVRRILDVIINNIGYRVIDSASAYSSETALGDIIYKYQNNETESNDKMTRNDLYIVTKVWPTDLGFLETQSDIYSSLDKLNTNYIDLYMIHWPRCMDHFDWMDCSQATGKHYLQTWQIMEKLYSEGRLLSLGVSNWDFHLWEELVRANGNQIIPQVVQNYFDIAHQDWELVEYLESWGAVYQGYATYRGVSQAQQRQQTEPYYMEWQKTLENLANLKSTDEYKVTPPQILLRWLVDSRIGVIPRSQRETHAKDNWNIWGFELTEEEHVQLNEKSIEEVRKRLKQEL